MDIMKRDDKRRPQVTGLCLKALAGEGVVSVHQHIVLDSTSVHMFFGLSIGRHPQTKQKFASFRY